MYNIKIPIGDWSDDGHGNCNIHEIRSNYDVHKLRQSYKDSCKLTGIQFNHSNNYTKTKNPIEICTEFEDSCITEETITILESFGLSGYDDEGFIDEDSFLRLLLDFIKLSLNDFEYDLTESSAPYLNGFWNDELNVQFGYGVM